STPVGKQFEKDVNDFTKELNRIAGTSLDALARPAREIEFFKNNPDHQNKDFLTITFYSTPTVAGLVSVTQMQVEMLEQESKALDKLAQDADAAVVKFEDLVPMVRPRSSTVAAGAKYVADMFIAASSKAAVPEMFRNGDPIPVVDDPRTGIKMGKVEFTASASNYDNTNRSRQSFKAKIVLNNNEYELEEEYIVVKPVIKVTTGNRPTLYRNCGNLVNFEVPDLGTDYNPTFSARGAAIERGSKVGQAIVVPSERECFVTVSSGGLVIGTEAFTVKNIPKPRYTARIGSAEVNLKDGIRANSLASMRITADAEANFKEEVPNDANYRIRRMEVALVRGTSPIQQQQFNNENVEIAAWRSQARPGDMLFIDIRTVERRNYKGDAERVDVVGSEGIIQIPIK
ncbi:MAG TPA: GldM family protein, partial [Cyclobacteriaceae bacterium]|nr:GldM family protein [Cyclobacteriaceae bacterium]